MHTSRQCSPPSRLARVLPERGVRRHVRSTVRAREQIDRRVLSRNERGGIVRPGNHSIVSSYILFSLRDETKGDLCFSLCVCVCLLARRKRRSRALSFSLILRFSKAETTALSLSLSLCDKLPFCDVDSLYLFSSLSKKTTADESVAREIHRDSVRL